MTLDFQPDSPSASTSGAGFDFQPDGSDIGFKMGDKRRMTDEQRLNLLKAQFSEPGHNPDWNSELQREIDRLSKKISAAPAAAPAFVPDAPPPARQPSQGDVRWSEPPQTLQDQNIAEADFNRRLNAWLKTTTGQYHAGANAREEFSKATGLADPMLNRDNAEIQHARETGDVVYGTGTTYNVVKPLAAVAGFAKGGPRGATLAEGAVRLAALGNNLQKAVQAGAINEDRAAEILANEMTKGVATDAAFNFGAPIVGKGLLGAGGWLASKIPGATWLGTKLETALAVARQKAGLPAAAPAPSLRDAKVAARAALTDDPARQQAVNELSSRAQAQGTDFIPTPGQVKGESGITETAVNKAFQAPFMAQEKTMKTAADGMLRDTTAPGVPLAAAQPSAQALGQEIQTAADATQMAVKKRLRPTFEAADKLGVQVDLSDVKGVIKKALLVDSRVPGGNLAPTERAQLEEILAHFDDNGVKVSAENALDFISRRKEQLRSTTADWKPSQTYDTLIGKLTTAADVAYARAAGAAGKGNTVRDLLAAQRDYKEVMGTVYDDAIKAALKKNPEDVGRFLWQGGNVSEPQQLQKMLAIAQREGAMNAAQAEELSKSVTRGFLQEAVPNIEAAAKWSQTLKESPTKRRTWEELTAAPGGKELRDAMTVVEHAAQIATVRNTAGHKTLLPFGRAAAGGLGVSYVTGVIHPGMAAVGLSIAGVMKMMSTAYTHGDKGAINLAAKVLRLRGIGTPASIQAMKALLPDFEQKAADLGADDVFEAAGTVSGAANAVPTAVRSAAGVQ